MPMPTCEKCGHPSYNLKRITAGEDVIMLCDRCLRPSKP